MKLTKSGQRLREFYSVVEATTRAQASSGNAKWTCSPTLRMGGWTLLALGAGLTGIAHAQESSTTPTQEGGDAGVLAEVIVTAQRRAERLQDVPISISAVGTEDLANRNVTSIVGLVGAVPGLAITNSSGVTSSNLVSIRGIAGQPLPVGANQATAFYLDGVYLPQPDAAIFALDDVERIEVLRGPQGTLYGRNSTAGAINIITRDPGSTMRGGVDVSYGEYDWFKARGSLSGPIAGGLSAGISGTYEQREGLYVNTVDGQRVEGGDSYTLRGKLRQTFLDETFIATLSADTSSIDEPKFFRNLYTLPSGAYVGIGDPERVTLVNPDRNVFRIDSEGVALTMTYRPTDNLELISITSYRELTRDTAFDAGLTLDSGAPAPSIYISARNASDTLYQELRGAITGDRVRTTAGLNYFHEDADYGQFTGTPFSNPIVHNNPVDSSDLDVYALFGQLEFDITDRLTAIAGVRYNEERRDFSVDYSQGTPGGLFTSGEVKDDAVVPSLGLNFKVTPDVLIYVKGGQGYQAPGFNYNPGARSPAGVFRAEELWAYESGVKSQFLDRRVTLNAAAFYYDYKDIQIRQVTQVGRTEVQNAASATLQGVEASFAVSITSDLTLGGHVTYLDAAYDDFCQPISAGAPQGSDPLCQPGFADRTDNRLSRAPEWSGGANLDYVIPIGSLGELGIHVDYSWEANSYYTPVNETVLSTGGWDKFGARLGFQFDEGPEVYAYGENLNDKVYLDGPQRNNATVAPGGVSEPRTYGVGVRYKF
jgi:iron complex outermembrane receptor protein